MNYPQVGNEIDNLGIAEMERDYRRHKHNIQCWGRTILEALLLTALFVTIFLVCAAIQWWQQG